MDPYYFLLIFGSSFFVAGVVILFLVFRFIHINRLKHIITGLVFLSGGVGIITVVIFMFPTPAHQQKLQEKMLMLLPNTIAQLTVYNRETPSETIIEIREREAIEEWAAILKNCHRFNPSHPRYEKRYMVIVEQAGDKYLYELRLDKRSTNTVDLTLLDRSNLGDGLNTLGHYRCEGLFEFVATILSEDY